jgi:hypothetical protein
MQFSLSSSYQKITLISSIVLLMEAEAQDPTWSQLRNSKRWHNQFKRDKTWRDWNGYQTPFLQTNPGEWINYVIYEVKVKGWYQCTKQHANDMHRGHEGECSIYSQTSALASRSGCLYLWGKISTIWYPSDRRIGASQSHPGHAGEEKIFQHL